MNAGVPGRFRTLSTDPGRNAVEPNETWSVRVGVAAWPSPPPTPRGDANEALWRSARRRPSPLSPSLSQAEDGRARRGRPLSPQRERGAAFPPRLIGRLPASLTPIALSNRSEAQLSSNTVMPIGLARKLFTGLLSLGHADTAAMTFISARRSM